MRYLRQSTQQTRVVGRVLSNVDWTVKADLAYNAAGMDFNIYKNGAKVDVTPANAPGDEYWLASVNGYYLFTFSAADTDTIGSLTVTIDATGYTAVEKAFTVLSAAAYDSLFGATALSTLAAGAAMTLTGAYDAAKTAASQTTANSILEDTGTTLPAQISALGATGAGVGSVSWTYTVTTNGVTPIPDVHVWVTSDIGGANVLRSGYTNSSGVVTFNLNPATYYFWSQKDGYNFTNPDSEAVA